MFIQEAEGKSNDLWLEMAQAQWIAANFITEDSEAVSAAATRRAIEYGVTLAKESARFDDVDVPEEVRRKLDNQSFVANAPADVVAKEHARVAELEQRASQLEQQLVRLAELT